MHFFFPSILFSEFSLSTTSFFFALKVWYKSVRMVTGTKICSMCSYLILNLGRFLVRFQVYALIVYFQSCLDFLFCSPKVWRLLWLSASFSILIKVIYASSVYNFPSMWALPHSQKLNSNDLGSLLFFSFENFSIEAAGKDRKKSKKMSAQVVCFRYPIVCSILCSCCGGFYAKPTSA